MTLETSYKYVHRILHRILLWKTVSTREPSTKVISLTTFSLDIQGEPLFWMTRPCPSLRLLIWLVGNITRYNWIMISTPTTKTICCLFFSNMDLFTNFGSMIQNTLLLQLTLHIFIFYLKFLTPTKQKTTTSTFS